MQVQRGEVDLCGHALTVSPSRAVAVDFSLTALSHGSVLVAAPDDADAEGRGSVVAVLESAAVIITLGLTGALAVALVFSAQFDRNGGCQLARKNSTVYLQR